MKFSTRSIDLFSKGFNCAQSVFAGSAGDTGIEEKTALRLASGFAAGLGYRGEMCGAVVGAYLAIGMKYGYSGAAEQEQKDHTYKLIAEFISEFERRNGSVMCKKLTGYDLSDPNQLKEAREKDVFREKCSKYIRDSAEILEELLKDN